MVKTKSYKVLTYFFPTKQVRIGLVVTGTRKDAQADTQLGGQ